MIRYDLECSAGHEFDGWFRNSAAYDEQSARQELLCPACGTHEVKKRLMTPGIPVKSNRREPPAAPERPASNQAPASQRAFSGPPDPRLQAMMKMLRELRRQVEANADYVGDKFADEARKIHYQETEPRGIYGETTLEEAGELLEEGIEVHPLPRLPEDSN